MSKPLVLVIGAGAVGACTAYYLAFRGARVVLIDQGRAGSGCSQGNAGQITPGHLPLPQAGTMWRNLYWLAKPDSPLYISPHFLGRHLDWFLKFSRSCTPSHTARATEVLCKLGRLSLRLFRQLAARTEFGFQELGRLEVCEDQSTLAGTLEEAQLLHRFGFDFDLLRPQEIQRTVPQLRHHAVGAVYYPESAHCEPYRFVRAITELAVTEGVTLLENTRALRLVTANEQVQAVVTTKGVLAADHVVVTTGAWTPLLFRQIGLRLRILPGKGYHIDVPRSSSLPDRPLVLVRDRVFVTPMDGRVRFAGTMEFSGYNLHLDERRLRLVSRAAEKAFGARREDAIDTWCHWRPMSADGLPYIGGTKRVQNLWIAAGHGMLGLTQAPATGWLIADAILGPETDFDMSPLSPDRP